MLLVPHAQVMAGGKWWGGEVGSLNAPTLSIIIFPPPPPPFFLNPFLSSARHEKRLGMSGEPLHGSVAEASPTSVHSLSSASSVFHPIEKRSSFPHFPSMMMM